MALYLGNSKVQVIMLDGVYKPIVYLPTPNSGELIETWNISATNNDNVIAELYNINNTYLLIIRGSGNMAHYSYYNIPWYNYKENIINVIIYDGVASIGDSAFYNCSSITSITIPDSTTNVGDSAFSGCSSLTSIIIPDGVASIGSSIFSYCLSLTSITYTGTIAQWNSIIFDTSWNENTGNYTIHCTDGDIAKDGAITYHNNQI